MLYGKCLRKRDFKKAVVTIQIKHGKLEEAIKMVKEGRWIWSIIPGRFYSSFNDPDSTVVFENEAENQAELDKLWEKVGANEEWTTWHAKFSELEAEEAIFEFWNVEYS